MYMYIILYIYVICQREPGARCMYHMHVPTYIQTPFVAQAPLEGKQIVLSLPRHNGTRLTSKAGIETTFGNT